MKLYLENQLREASGETADNLLRKGWQEAPPQPSPDAQWVNGGWVVPEPLPPPEVSVSILAFRFALVNAGLLDLVEACINGIPDETEKKNALTWWEFARTVKRHHPIVEQIGAALGKSDEEINAIFAAAQAIDSTL